MKAHNNTHTSGGLLLLSRQLGLVFMLLGSLLLPIMNAHADPSPIRDGFNSNTLPANDDGSTGLVPLGFSINFFGVGFTEGYVNNNGNMTFDQPLGTFTPFGLASTNTKIIAPFFADVDTQQLGSNPVTYGQGTVGSRPAFAVNWLNVACFATPNGGYNTLQMVLIDRSDIGAGDFDIEFNYGSILWETGQASGGDGICQNGNTVRIGYSNGVSNSFELDGSGIAGAFLDSNLATGLIYNNRNTLQTGRYLFPVRNGNAPFGHSVAGTVFANDTYTPLPDALVQICSTQLDTFCTLTSSNSNGDYTIGGLTDNSYEVKAFAPANTQYLPATIPVVLTGADLEHQDIVLLGPEPLPSGTNILPNIGVSPGGIPVVYWQNPLNLTTTGCSGGSASYTITDELGNVIAAGAMPETAGSPGHYLAIVPSLYPNHGQVTVSITINCPGGSSVDIRFAMYIDPSGVVKDTFGVPINGATVTLYRSDSSAGPFVIVPDGDAIMSPTNRTNPFTTQVQGLFGWDVIAGYYKVRAEKVGCTAPAPNNAQNFVETEVLTIPPPVTDLLLVLDCGTPPYGVCDVTQDGAVSRVDILNISSRLRSTVAVGTLGDVNHDGRITSLDTRGCTLQCTLPGCAEPTP